MVVKKALHFDGEYVDFVLRPKEYWLSSHIVFKTIDLRHWDVNLAIPNRKY